jgi:magnesium transporter
MSEYSMMTGSENWRVSYPLFMIGMAVLGFFSYHWLKYLEKKDREKDAKV